MIVLSGVKAAEANTSTEHGADDSIRGAVLISELSVKSYAKLTHQNTLLVMASREE
jgi:hypothetical protein